MTVFHLTHLNLSKKSIYFSATQEMEAASSVLPSVTLWDYRRISELWVLLTGAGIIMWLRTCCCSRAGFVCVPAVGWTKAPHDTRRKEGLSNPQESELPS